MAGPAYILIDEHGYITLYWGDGTEPEPVILWQGPRVEDPAQMAETAAALRAWAEENGYAVIVPAYSPPNAGSALDLLNGVVRRADREALQRILDDLWRLGDNEARRTGH